MRLKPGPLVAVAALAPARAAPTAMFTAAISSSVWTTATSAPGRWVWASRKTLSSVAGLMG